MPVNIDLLDDAEHVTERAGEAVASAFRLLERRSSAGEKVLAVGGSTAWLLVALDSSRRKGRAELTGEGGPEVLTAIAAALRDGGMVELALEPSPDPDALSRAFEAAGWRVTASETGLVALNRSRLKGLWAAASALVGARRSR